MVANWQIHSDFLFHGPMILFICTAKVAHSQLSNHFWSVSISELELICSGCLKYFTKLLILGFLNSRLNPFFKQHITSWQRTWEQSSVAKHLTCHQSYSRVKCSGSIKFSALILNLETHEGNNMSPWRGIGKSYL